MGDLHLRVVNDDNVVVNRDPGGANDNRIADGFVVKSHVATNDVVEVNGALGDSESNRSGFTARASLFGFCRMALATLARIHLRPLLSSCSLALTFQILSSTETKVGLAFVE